MRLRTLLSDLNYAQSRLLELRTGLVFTEETRRRQEIAALNALLQDDEPRRR